MVFRGTASLLFRDACQAHQARRGTPVDAQGSFALASVGQKSVQPKIGFADSLYVVCQKASCSDSARPRDALALKASYE